MKDNRLIITGDITKKSWVEKAVETGIQGFRDVVFQGVMEINRDLAEVINRQSLEDLPMIIACMHIMERALRESQAWIPYTDDIVKTYEEMIGTTTGADRVMIPRELEKMIEEWKRREKKQT